MRQNPGESRGFLLADASREGPGKRPSVGIRWEYGRSKRPNTANSGFWRIPIRRSHGAITAEGKRSRPTRARPSHRTTTRSYGRRLPSPASYTRLRRDPHYESGCPSAWLLWGEHPANADQRRCTSPASLERATARSQHAASRVRGRRQTSRACGARQTQSNPSPYPALHRATTRMDPWVDSRKSSGNTCRMTVIELARATGIPARTIRHLLRAGRLRGIQEGGRRRWRIDDTEVERVRGWVRSRV